jgi:hypothetical protein
VKNPQGRSLKLMAYLEPHGGAAGTLT